MTVGRILTDLALKESKLKPSLFYKVNESGNLEGILCLHVDDIFLAGKRSFKGLTEMMKAKIMIGKHRRDDLLR